MSSPGPHVRVEKIRYGRGGRVILDGVDLVARTGEMTVVLGPSGSGKSTLLAIIAGLEQPDSGYLYNPHSPARTGVVLQAYALLGLLTAAENVELPLQARRPLRRDRDAIRSTAHAALHRVGLDSVPDHLIEELSGGQQQRVALARALAIEPALLIADEPTAELDAATRAHVIDTLHATTRAGTTVIIATHDDHLTDRADAVLRLEP